MKRPVPGTVASLLTVSAVVLSAAACSSSGGAVAPTSTPVSSAPSSAPPATSSSAPVPSPSSSTPPPPLSPYEADPAVRAIRAWADQAARTVNSGRYTDARLQALMTPAFAASMKLLLGPVVGQRFPGPIPLTPVRVEVHGASERYVEMCAIVNGYAVNARTGRPEHRRAVRAVDGGAHRSGGIWRMDAFYDGSFSCKGVAVPTPSFSPKVGR